MGDIYKLLQRKADRTHEILFSKCPSHDSLEPVMLDIGFKSLPAKVDDEGSFIVLTGTKVKPYGIGVDNPPELVFLYNKKGGIFVETSLIRNIIREHRDSIDIVIDETYSIMGVKLNLGVLSKYVSESFLDSLTALH